MRERGIIPSTRQDPYVVWFHKNKTMTDMEKIGSTKHRINEPNPEFYDTVFAYDWMQGTGQVNPNDFIILINNLK